VKLIVTKMKHF